MPRNNYTASANKGTEDIPNYAYRNADTPLLDEITRDSKYVFKDAFVEYKSRIDLQLVKIDERLEKIESQNDTNYEKYEKMTNKLFNRNTLIIAIIAIILGAFQFLVPYLVNKDDSQRIEGFITRMETIETRVFGKH